MTDFTRTFSDIDVNETTGVVRRLSGTYTLGTVAEPKCRLTSIERTTTTIPIDARSGEKHGCDR
jgi:hypothetical protein